MSIDERLRTGLHDNTEHLLPDLEHELAATYERVRIRRVRRVGLTAVAAAAVAAAVLRWGDLPALRDAEPIAPDPGPRSATDLVGVHGRLDPGTYSLALLGETGKDPLPRAILEVPDGYVSNGGWILDAGNDAASDPEALGSVLQVWRVDDVLSSPCAPGRADSVGPTSADLARALHQQPGPSTRPVPTVLDGHPGLYLEVVVPRDAPLDDCPDDNYSLWRGGQDLGPWESGLPGIVHHLWIVEVDGTRLVTVVSNYPAQPTSQHQQLIEIAESIRFEDPRS